MGTNSQRIHRSTQGAHAPWTARRRWLFMRELERQRPAAGERLDELARSPFNALADHIEEHSPLEDELWIVDWDASMAAPLAMHDVRIEEALQANFNG